MNLHEGRRVIIKGIGFETSRRLLNNAIPRPVQDTLVALAPPNRERLGNVSLTMIVAHGLFAQGYTPGTQEPSIMPYLDGIAFSLGARASFPDLPNSSNPVANEWLAVLLENLEKAFRRGDYISLIGHSLGTRAIMLLLREIVRNPKLQKYTERIRHIALLSPLSDENLSYRREEKMPNYRTFFAPEAGGAISEAERDQIIQSFSALMHIIYAQDDRVVEPGFSEKLKTQYRVANSRTLVLETGGHMDPSAGPQVSEFLRSKLVGLAQPTAPINWTNASVY